MTQRLPNSLPESKVNAPNGTNTREPNIRISKINGGFLEIKLAEISAKEIIPNSVVKANNVKQAPIIILKNMAILLGTKA